MGDQPPADSSQILIVAAIGPVVLSSLVALVAWLLMRRRGRGGRS